MAFFTIVIPCRNAETTLPATLASLFAQDFTNWRAVIVDDASTDRTPAILDQAVLDPRVTVIRGDGAGPSPARNRAAEGAEGWIAFLDADDIWPKDRLSHLANAIEAGGGDAFYGVCGFFADELSAPSAYSRPKPGALAAADVLGENPTCTMSNLTIRADLWRSVGGLDPQMVHAEDLDLLIRLTAAGARIIGLNSILTLYRTSPYGLSADLAAMERGWRACLARARSLGVANDRLAAVAEARQLRYLARRALRLGAPGAARLAARGVFASPWGFFGDFRRGAITLIAAMASPFIPKHIAHRLFAR